MNDNMFPQRQHAIQLVGPGELRHNPDKEVYKPGAHQILARVEAVGLCFSDLKLLKQFSQHVRKGEILEGLEREILAQIPSYVPGEKPTVPGHEVVCRIVAVGDQVRHHRVGERCLVQTDYRDLKTAGSNAAFGYNFEGGLQEYVLMDERVVMDAASGERFLIPVDEALSASAVALVEPWACVEDSYVNPERSRIKLGGRLLVVIDAGRSALGLEQAMGQGQPASLTVVCPDSSQKEQLHGLPVLLAWAADASVLPDQSFDDIVYFGSAKSTIEILNDKLAAGGIMNIVTDGRMIGEKVSVGIGRVHYGMTRWIGNHGAGAAESYSVIPENGEIRRGEEVAIIGAAGPMGQMHVIRTLCLEAQGLSLVCTDVDDDRLKTLMTKAVPLSEIRRIPLKASNTRKDPLQGKFTYFILLVPAGAMVADAIAHSKDGCLINIFAGIPAATRHDLDLDTYISNHCFMFGTSGSVIQDMRIVLNKVRSGQLDTNISVDAVSGMAGVAEAIAAVENRSLAGKIIVYPALHDVGLIPLAELDRRFPTVARKLAKGQWTPAAEEELLRVAAG